MSRKYNVMVKMVVDIPVEVYAIDYSEARALAINKVEDLGPETFKNNDRFYMTPEEDGTYEEIQ